MSDQIETRIPPPSQVITLELPRVEASPPWEDTQPLGDTALAMRMRYAPAEAALRAVGGKSGLPFELLIVALLAIFFALYPLARGYPSLPITNACMIALSMLLVRTPVLWAARHASPRLPTLLGGACVAGILWGYVLWTLTDQGQWMIVPASLAARNLQQLAWFAFSPGGRVLFSPAYQEAIAATPDFVLPAPLRWTARRWNVFSRRS